VRAKTVLLTGVAGFIGSHAAERFLEQGWRVVGVDNFNDYYDVAQKEDNLRELSTHIDFELIRGDIRDSLLIQRLFNENKFDSVVHLAAMAGVRASVDEPEHYFDVNVTGTLRLLEAVRRAEYRPNFVLGSTSSVYGRSTEIPFLEDHSADRPLAPYPASKRSAELLGHTYFHMHGVDFTALRFFTVYGERNRPDMLPFLVMENIRHGAPLSIYNDGDMHRDWTYVGDIAKGVVAAAERRLGYQVMNLGKGEPVQLASFIGKLAARAQGTATWTSSQMPAADVPYTYANIEKARKLLDYRPEVSVDDGIDRFYRWYEARPQRGI
jgi:UDP-glucuronate 4-epimerase